MSFIKETSSDFLKNYASRIIQSLQTLELVEELHGTEAMKKLIDSVSEYLCDCDFDVSNDDLHTALDIGQFIEILPSGDVAFINDENVVFTWDDKIENWRQWEYTCDIVPDPSNVN